MKNRLFILFALLATFSLASCKKVAEIVTPEPSISVIKTELAIPGKGGEATVEVEAKGAYEATVDKSWLGISKEGSKIVLSADENPSLESRYATLTIKDSETKIELTVQQFGQRSSGFAPGDINTNADAAEFTFPYSYDAMMSATTDADWITLNVTAESLNVKIAENTVPGTAENPSRTAEIKWVLGADNGTIKVTQKNQSFMKEDANWTVEYLGVQPYTFSDGSTEDVEEIQNTVADPSASGMYGITYFAKSDFASSGLELADYISDVVAPEYVESIEDVIEYYAAYGYTLTFGDFLFEESDFEIFDIFDPGDYYGVVIGFTEDADLTGHYAYCEFTKKGSGGGDNPGGEAGYNSWLGQWTDVAGSTWTVAKKVEGESYTITGVEGITTLPLAAEYDSSTKSLIVRAQSEIGTLESQNYGTFTMGYFGIATDGYFYTPNDPSKAYAVFTATLASDGASASLVGGTVTGDDGEVSIVKGIYIGESSEGKYYSVSSKQVTLPSTITKVGGGDGGDGGDGGSGSADYNKFLGGFTVTPADASTDAWTTTIKQNVADKSFKAYAWQGWDDDWMSPADADFSNGAIVFKGGTGTPAATNVQVDDSGEGFNIYYMGRIEYQGQNYVITSGTSMYDCCKGTIDNSGNIVLNGLDVELNVGTFTFIDYSIVAMSEDEETIYTFKNMMGNFPVTMKKSGSGSSVKTLGLSLKNAEKIDPSHVITMDQVMAKVQPLKVSPKAVLSTNVRKHIRK